jgi:hypothetical protein
LAETNAPMVNRSAIAHTKGTRSKTEQPPVWKFEIIHETSELGPSLWSELGQNLGPFFEAGRNALGNIYASVAQLLLERKEEFEDWRAERKVRQTIAVRSARNTHSAAETHLVEVGAGFNDRPASTSK